MPPITLKRYQKEFEHSYTFGVFPTLELLHHRPEQVVSVLIHSKGERNDGVQKIEQVCRERRIRVEQNDTAIERITNKGNEWAVGVFRKYEQTLDPSANHVVLVNPGDMGNLGTILRTMLAFRFQNLALIRPAVDAFDPRVVRASMGALFQVAVQYFDSFDAYQDTYTHALYPFLTSAQSAVGDVSLGKPFTLIFGNESAGLPESFLSVGQPLLIPFDPRVDSLNLSVAVGIALYAASSDTLRGLMGDGYIAS
jgi:TrmH family RNA methyltransferase